LRFQTATFKQGLELSFVPEAGTSTSFFDSFSDVADLPGVSVVYYDDAQALLGGHWKSHSVAVSYREDKHCKHSEAIFFNSQLVTLPNGIVIAWDGVKQVEVSMPQSFKGNLCGICGDIDDSAMYIGGHDVSHADDDVGCPTKAATLTMSDIVNDSWFPSRRL
jgi:hypothetical protein